MQTVVANTTHITGILGLHKNTAPSSSVLSKAPSTLGKSWNIFIFSQGSGHKVQTIPCQEWAWKKLSMTWLRADSTHVKQLWGMCLHSRGQFTCLKALAASRFSSCIVIQYQCLYQCPGRNNDYWWILVLFVHVWNSWSPTFQLFRTALIILSCLVWHVVSEAPALC